MLDDEMWLHRLREVSELTAIPLVASGDVLMHVRSRKPLQDVMTATRVGKPLTECGLDLRTNAEQHLSTRLRLSQRFPAELLEETLRVAERCDFSLDELSYQYPDEVVPEGETPTSYLRRLDRYDFVNGSVYGQARTFIRNTGIAYSGTKAITLDQDRYVTGGNVDSLTGTFNLSTFNSATNDIRLDFRYKNHGQKINAANKVWIRGSEADNWIEVYDLYANQNPADGSYKLSGSIELTTHLLLMHKHSPAVSRYVGASGENTLLLITSRLQVIHLMISEFIRLLMTYSWSVLIRRACLAPWDARG